MARKTAVFQPRKCERCGADFTPNGATQRMCDICRRETRKEYNREWWRKNHPGYVERGTPRPPCCICGMPSVASYDGNRYCNKHWLRMKNHGSPDLLTRKSTCTFETLGDVVEVTTAKGEKILADARDLDVIKDYSWCVNKEGYAVARVDGKVVKMNRHILGKECEGAVVDHKNRNRLDNRRCNLRVCTQKENSRNTSPTVTNKTGLLGIRVTKCGRYNVRITANRKQLHVGNFVSKKDAIKARRYAEDVYHGDYGSHRAEEVPEPNFLG